MPRGAPDDSNIRIESGVYRLDDMAELAVRLGSPVAYHRYGTVLCVDGFEDGMNAWLHINNGTGGDVVPTTDFSYQGKNAIRMKTGTGASPNSSLYKYLPPVDAGKCGIQVTLAVDVYCRLFDIALTYGLPPYVYYFRIRYTHATGILSYYDVSGSYLDFGDCGVLFAQPGNWHNIKLVIDTANLKYVRFYLDNVLYSMADLEPPKASWTQGEFLGPLIDVWGNGSLSTSLYVDNVIVTFNEF